MAEQPNLLVVCTDQQAATTLGAYGNDRIETPALDGLASDGVVFEHAYASAPSCTPARSTIVTGLYPHANGCIENDVHLPSDARCLPELADFDDYATAYMGKWHLGDEVFAQHGFDEWVSTLDVFHSQYSDGRPAGVHSTYHDFLIENGFEPDHEEDGFRWFSLPFALSLPEEYTQPAYLAREASRFVRENRDRPFVLFVNVHEPHPPYTSPRDDQYDPDDVVLPENFDHDGFDDQPLRIRLMREAVRTGLAGRLPSYWSGPPDEADWRELLSNYWGLASLVDTHVGTILEALDDCGLADDTVTVYTSDHGDMMGSQGLVAKFATFEEAIRVPLLVRVPGADRNGSRIDAPVGQVDLVPTLLDALGRPRPDHLHGTSWLPTLRGGEPPERDVFVVRNGSKTLGMGGRADGTRPRIQPDVEPAWLELASREEIVRAMIEPSRTIVTPEGWKLTYRQSGEHELYDLEEDPGETTDLSSDPSHGELIEALVDRIVAWQARVRDPVYLP